MVFRLWEKSQSRVNHVIKTVTYSCPGKIDIENMKFNLFSNYTKLIWLWDFYKNHLRYNIIHIDYM